MNRSLLLFAGALVVGTSQLGCAAIFQGSKQEVRIESDPPGATIRTAQGGTLGTTPATLQLDRGKTPSIVVAHPEHADAQVPLKKSPGTLWVVLDILTCVALWCPGVVVDAASGAWNEYDEPPRVHLKPAAPAASGPAPALKQAPSATPGDPSPAPPAPSPTDTSL